MDYQRIIILLALAVTTYMLILAWNDDYGQGHRVAPPEQVITPGAISDGLTAAGESGEINSEIVPEMDDSVPSLTPESVSGMVPGEQTNTFANAAGRYIHVRTNVLDVKIDSRGGDIVQVALPHYPITLDQPDVPYILVDPENNYTAQSGLIGPNGTDKSGHRPTFQIEKSDYVMGDEASLTVTLKLIQDTGAEIQKRFIFHRDDYLIGVEYEVFNRTAAPWQGALFAQIKRDGQPPVEATGNSMGLQPYVGGATRADSELYAKLEFDDIEEESYKASITKGYMAMVQHYFVSAWIPSGEGQNVYSARKLKDKDIYVFGFTTPATTVAVGSSTVLAAGFYAGPKDQYRLRDLAEGLDLTVDYGFLWWLAQPLFFLLTTLHGYLGNWGLAIICLTMIVKAVLFPLSAASFRSMAKMRKLQPEMVKLKERFGDDRQQFSQAMMELYKKEGANPLGGCFPILLQMPVFLALYWTLMESVELRQAPFALWIHDLSTMDPYFILPILMGISMYLTQLMQPEPPDPVQAKVFKLMPIMFTFFFLWFPSGLVLYWLVNNVLSILQQWYVTRQIDKQ